MSSFVTIILSPFIWSLLGDSEAIIVIKRWSSLILVLIALLLWEGEGCGMEVVDVSPCIITHY